ncbi:hypothetical protein [Microbacterium sp.]|nr:hypothetical protein [Microbacterium sp.]
MRWRSGLVAGAVLLSLSVTGCATETAALTASATCPTPPGGGTWGAPGQG